MGPKARPQRPPNRAGDSTELSLPEVSAIKAMSPEAMAAIEKLCGVHRNLFRSGGEDGRRDTDNYSGRLSVVTSCASCAP